MSIWIEIHCDVNAPPGPGAFGPSCYSHKGDSPGVMALNASRVPTFLTYLSRQAIRQGWTRGPNGDWCCPACKEKPE